MSDELLSPAPPETNGGGHELPKSFESLERKRRGVKPGQKRGSYNKPSHERPAPTSVAVSVPAFTPDSVRPVVSLPFNLAFVKTGFDGFLLSPSEEANLSHSGAMVFNEWIQVDPKFLALITFGLSLSSLAIAKTMMYKKALFEFHLKQEEDRKAKEAGGTQTPPAA